MADVVWNFKFASQPVYELLGEVVSTQDIPVAIPTAFLMQAGSFHVAFEGNFTVNGYALTGGTITGFKAFSSGVLVLEATGYSIDAKAFQASFAGNTFVTFLHLTDMPMTLNGSEMSDSMNGSFEGLVHPRRIFGNGGNDDILGGGGDDFISGGAGQDGLYGGAGSDTADYSEKIDDVVVTLTGSTVAVVKVGSVDEDTIRDIENINGGSGNDTLTGDGLANRLVGNDGDDRLAGGDGNDVLVGGAGRDRIDGGRGNDEIDGGAGKDVVVGGKNSDSFVFSTTLDPGDNVDKIKDFKPGADTIVLANAIFTALAPGELKGKYFAVGEKAKDGNDHLIYDDGKLSYDADGKGGEKAILFAKLKGAPDIDAGDFVIV
jgi:hypothetical protein